jgi:recombinational DNA repair protein (RecF pathway)
MGRKRVTNCYDCGIDLPQTKNKRGGLCSKCSYSRNKDWQREYSLKRSVMKRGNKISDKDWDKIKLLIIRWENNFISPIDYYTITHFAIETGWAFNVELLEPKEQIDTYIKKLKELYLKSLKKDEEPKKVKKVVKEDVLEKRLKRKDWYKKHKEKILLKRKEWYEKNKEEVSEKRKEYYQKKKCLI